MLPPFDEIVSNFELLDDWEERYRYLIELGREMPPLPPEAHSEANKVQGCASQVWLDIKTDQSAPDPRLDFTGDSDAHIVKGLVALLVALLSGKPASKVLDTDPIAEFEKLGLSAHLTPQRSNGLRSMVNRVRNEAARVAAPA
jgi:cysteine desulfuration protein SufE